MLCRTEEVVRLVYDVIRETYRVIHVPSSLAKVVAGPREWLLKRVAPRSHCLDNCIADGRHAECPGIVIWLVAMAALVCTADSQSTAICTLNALFVLVMQLPVPLPVPTMFTEDYIAEQAQDAVLPESGALTFADLDVQPPKKVTLGVPIEHVRHFRVGGYDLGTTSQDTTTGGAGYGT